MRVCMLLRNPFTRDARALREARSLASAGHEVTVVATTGPGLAVHEDRDGVRVVRSVRAGALAGPTIRAAAGESGGARRLPRPVPLVWWRDRALGQRMTRAAFAQEADVFHAHDLPTLEAAWLAARAKGARLVYDAHELYPEIAGLGRGERERWRRLEARLIGNADAVLTPSASRAEELARRYGVSPVVVMNCPPRTPEPDPKLSPLAGLRREGERLLVYAGGFTPNRGLGNLVHAVSVLERCRLVFVGFGPLEGALRAAAGRANAPVEFVAAVPPDDVVRVAAGADVGLAPYLPVGLNNALAAPNKLYEYLHAGLAVAGSDVPEIRRVVTEHDVGALFDAADPRSIATAVNAIVEQPAKLTAMKQRARAAAALYSWETQERVLLDVYERLAR